MGNLMSGISTLATRAGGKNKRADDDFSDRLNYKFTTFMLLVFCMLVTGRQHVGHPINCWCPARFKDPQIDYANSLCWTKNTYYVPIEGDIPKSDSGRTRLELQYYQWVPIVLLVQAVLFYFPCVIWRLLHDKSGVNITTLCTTLEDKGNLDPDTRNKTIRYIVRHLHRCFDMIRIHSSHGCQRHTQKLVKKCPLICGKRYGNYILSLYVACKMLYIGNAIGQVYILNAFLGNGTDYSFYGVGVLVDMLKSRDWTTSDRFPRVTLCDFKIREFAHNIHRYTLQCVLPINLFNEKIYIILWFWFVLVAIVNSYSLLQWLFYMAGNNKVDYIKRHLKNMGMFDKESDKKYLNTFVEEYMQHDGVFVMRLMTKNACDISVSEIVCGLFTIFKQSRTNGSIM
ncbi:unnamed protein product [Owenia fusiformis]|uniref:Innexin n=1 Tax=Owenia fusiformis TaxID=6347 RepID=A0A8S4QBK8_OWEFU|nr:unnamed protein product [Owenia fusiformis]